MDNFLSKIKYWFPKLVQVIAFITTIWCVSTYSNHIQLFNVDKISVVGNTFVTTNTILEKINKNSLKSLFEIDLENIQSAVNEIEYIQTTKVYRILPSTVVVEVVEREPVVLLNDGNNLFMVDKHHELLPASNKAINNYPVPVINFEKNNTISEDEMVSTVITMMKFYPELYLEMSEFNNIKDEYVFVSDNRTNIYLGSNEILDKMILLREFLRTVKHAKEMKNYSFIDLRIPNQVIVKERGRRYNS